MSEWFGCKFNLHDKVKKPKGYEFEGTVQSCFLNRSGEWRFVVEHATIIGLLHIFSGNQLELINDE